ncbi:MAG: tRNA epoxyqueuosine(34) reductase QueG, partial [Candidatus Acidiferrales bacterium]
MNNTSETAWIIEQASALGFDLCGVVNAQKFPELNLTKEWLARGYAGEMKYLSDERRGDPQSVMPGLRSVIVCALNYNSPAPRSVDALPLEQAEPRGWISRYAWGQDYHEILQQKLQDLASSLAERFTEPFKTRIYADTGPLNERVFAKHAGLGWLGKNTLLLNSKLGSWFFLGAILTTLDITPTLGPAELPPPDLCGSCTKCIDACPTGALVEPYVMDARLCISYLTIELRGSIPEELREPMGRHVFGCDICQDVCPWNRRAPVTQAVEFQARAFPNATQCDPRESVPTVTKGDDEDSLFLPRLEWLAAMNDEQFRTAFRGSPIKRTKWRGLVRNACIALGNSAPAPGSPRHESI